MSHPDRWQRRRCGCGPFGFAQGRLDGHINVLGADALDGVATVAGDPVRRPRDADQPLDVQVQKVARTSMLVAWINHWRFQITHPAQLQPTQDTAHRSPAQPVAWAIRKPVQRSRGRASTRPINSVEVGRCSRPGRELRSRRPSTPNSRYRRTHLAAVFALTLKLAGPASTSDPVP